MFLIASMVGQTWTRRSFSKLWYMFTDILVKALASYSLFILKMEDSPGCVPLRGCVLLFIGHKPHVNLLNQPLCPHPWNLFSEAYNLKSLQMKARFHPYLFTTKIPRLNWFIAPFGWWGPNTYSCGSGARVGCSLITGLVDLQLLLSTYFSVLGQN